MRDARAQPVSAAVRIVTDIRDRGRKRGARPRPGPQRVFVRRQLDAAADAELTLHRFRRLAGDVGRQAAQARRREGQEPVHVAHWTARALSTPWMDATRSTSPAGTRPSMSISV
jgi:hypothetical protein